MRETTNSIQEVCSQGGEVTRDANPLHGAFVTLSQAMFTLAVLLCNQGYGHEGPPFPVLMDEQILDYSISLWADPDIGTGEFYVVVEPLDAQNEIELAKIEVWVQPKSERLPKIAYLANRQNLRNQIQYLAEPQFDQQDMFDVGIVITNSNGETSQLLTEVEATPPGLGPWDLVIYLFPFILFGGLWTLGFSKRRRHRNSSSPTLTTNHISAHQSNHASEQSSALAKSAQEN